jgi:hypothetical protein
MQQWSPQSVNARPLLELAEFVLNNAIRAREHSATWSAYLDQIPRAELEALAELTPASSARRLLDARIALGAS